MVANNLSGWFSQISQNYTRKVGFTLYLGDQPDKLESPESGGRVHECESRTACNRDAKLRGTTVLSPEAKTAGLV